jgi:hypothetical protein
MATDIVGGKFFVGSFWLGLRADHRASQASGPAQYGETAGDVAEPAPQVVVAVVAGLVVVGEDLKRVRLPERPVLRSALGISSAGAQRSPLAI